VNTWPPEPASSWDLIPYTGDNQFKRQRLRHLDRIRQVVELVRQHDYVVLLGPAYSEKTRLLYDVDAQLGTGESFTPVYVNLWRVRTDDEAAFFASLAQFICRSERINSLPYVDPALAERCYDGTSYRTFLDTFVRHHDRHLVLLIDHLEVLPKDLTHRLLQVLRGAYMERNLLNPYKLDVVVAGSAALAELAHDSTSPFNMAHGVFQGPLTEAASLALAEANLEAAGTSFSEGAVESCAYWADGDSYLIPLLISHCQDKVYGYRNQRITRTVIDRTAEELVAAPPCEPIRAAIQGIEEDPDTLLDIVALLREDVLPRNQAHQTILRTGLDRLQLSGAVVLDGESYRIKNEIYRRALRCHFTQGRVAHVLRMNGRWQEAIQFLSTQLESGPLGPTEVEASRTVLLDAIVQSIYAANCEDDAYRALLEGIHMGFHLSGIRIYRAYAGRGELRLVESDETSLSVPEVIDLNDEAQAEVRTFRGGDYALRGELGSRRLLAALTPERRPIGMVTIDHFSAETEEHVHPPHLLSLLRFLRHASSAIENVLMRSAIQEIGRAVLNANTVTSNLDHVLQVVLNATGGDAAQLYLLEPPRTCLTRIVHTGDITATRDAGDARIDLALTSHPAVQALNNKLLTPARQVTPPGMYAYLPLTAGGGELGVLVLFFGMQKAGINAEERKTLVTFADQVAIAVHNMQLLRRTDEALQEKVREAESLQRQAELNRDQELQDVAAALVHRLGGAIGDVPVHLARVRWAVDNGEDWLAARQETYTAAEHVEKRILSLQDLLPTLEDIANLASIELRPVDLSRLLQDVVNDVTGDFRQVTTDQDIVPDVIIEGNHSLLRDALRSLLENACEAMPGGGTLAVRLVRLDGGRCQIQIQDTGVGIAEKHKDNMFKLGFSTKRDRGRNRGFGMFTCRAIVRKHRGEISIDSAEGRGTLVKAVLPRLGV
jgi:signal transduction histidine kinase